MIGKVVCVSKPHIWSVTPGKIYDLYYNKLQYKNNDIYILLLCCIYISYFIF